MILKLPSSLNLHLFLGENGVRPKDTLAYLRATLRKAVPYYRMKLMVVGLQVSKSSGNVLFMAHPCENDKMFSGSLLVRAHPLENDKMCSGSVLARAHPRYSGKKCPGRGLVRAHPRDNDKMCSGSVLGRAHPNFLHYEYRRTENSSKGAFEVD